MLSEHEAGPADALLTLCHYGDYTVPECHEVHKAIFKTQAAFPYDLKVLYRHFADPETSPRGYLLAKAAEAAAKQMAFWEVHYRLMRSQSQLDTDSLVDFAAQLELEPASFLEAFQSEEVADKVNADYQAGLIDGVQNVPALLLNGERVTGVLDYKMLMRRITSRLRPSG